MTLIGVTAMQGTTQQEGMAGNMRNSNLAFQAAEAALLAGESIIAPPAVMPASTAFNNATPGLITTQVTGIDVGGFWMAFNWTALSQALPNNTLSDVIQQPSYVIEEDSASGAIPPCPGTAGVRCFRITARGVGGTADAVAILQSTYAR